MYVTMTLNGVVQGLAWTFLKFCQSFRLQLMLSRRMWTQLTLAVVRAKFDVNRSIESLLRDEYADFC